MILDTKIKEPADYKDYPIDYSAWLAENSPGDTLVGATKSVNCLSNPTDTAMTVPNLVVSATAVAPWVAGGTVGYTYLVTLIVTTAAGRVDTCEIKFKVKGT